MGIGDQIINMGSATHVRTVYDNQPNQDCDIETGFIEFNNQVVPVWRPLTPERKSDEEWHPIYRVAMKKNRETRWLLAERGRVEVAGKECELPLAELEIRPALKWYLEQSTAN